MSSFYEGAANFTLDLDKLRHTLGISTVDSVIDLTGHIDCGTLVGRGGSGIVYEGKWRHDNMSHSNGAGPPFPKVAVKSINIMPMPKEGKEKDKRFKKIKRELELWKKLKHDRVLPLIGIARINGDPNQPAFVSPWMEHGNILEFLKQNPSSPVLRFIKGIAEGVHYLHTFEPEIVHGDIKGANVLITHRLEACLCDFGLSRFAMDNTLWKTSAAQANGTLRWMAPELLDGDICVPTKESDMYAYAMTCYEILSGNKPFESVSNDVAVMLKVLKRERPEHCTSFHPGIWKIITQCWTHEPNRRPLVGDVVRYIEHIFKVPTHQLYLTLEISDVGSVIDLTGHIDCGEFFAQGASGSIYKGKWKNVDTAHSYGISLPFPKVAVKLLTMPPLKKQQEKDIRFKKIQRELELWGKLKHDRILSLIGIARIGGELDQLAFVSPWMENGNILDFLKQNPSSPILRFLRDIIEGVHFLHTFKPEIVHENIQAANVLITHRLEACLCSFGSSRLPINNICWGTIRPNACGTLRWMAPERLILGVSTKESDMYAYAMTCYEILSGCVPFKSTTSDFEVGLKVLKGRRPKNDPSFHPEIWKIITQCWAHEPTDRPSAGDARRSIQDIFEASKEEQEHRRS